jgi:hypothetical protein
MDNYIPPGREKIAERDKKWPARTFPSEYLFICALRECMGLDPREDMFGQGSFKRGKGFKK